MCTRVAWWFAAATVLLTSTGSVCAQEDARIAAAIERLGSESPAIRANARKAILAIGKPGVDALRRATAASDELPPELLFVIAEDIGRERRDVRFTESWDSGEKSWRVAWCPDGKQLALLQKHGGPVKMLDTGWQPTGDHFGEDTAYFAIDPKDKTVAFNNGAGEIVIAERATDRSVCIPVIDRPSIAYSPDGLHIATGGYAHAVDVWSVVDGSRATRLDVEGTKGGLTPVFSPDGKLLVVGNRNDKTHVFQVDAGELLHVLDRKQSHQPVFSPDGKLLAIAYVDGNLGIWDVASGKLVKLLPGQAEEVFTLAWSADGRLLASAGLAGPIVIWSGKHLAKLMELDAGSERVFKLAFRPDGRVLVAAGNETTRAWAVEVDG